MAEIGRLVAIDGATGTVELSDGRCVGFLMWMFRPENTTPPLGIEVEVDLITRRSTGQWWSRSVTATTWTPEAEPEDGDDGSPDDHEGPMQLERPNGEQLPEHYPDEPTRSIAEVWRDLEQWYADNTPGLGALAPGASDADLARLTNAIGRALPDEIVAAYRIHDGSAVVPNDDGATYHDESLIGGLSLMSYAMMLDELENAVQMSVGIGEEHIRTRGPVKKREWSPAWIPFALRYGSSDYLCFDLDPAPGGRVGQVIEASPKSYERRVLCNGITCFLEGLLVSLRAGDYELVPA